ncbi:hypothetical protein LCGC14_2525380 [marine sediment metagenome]|uniref:Uncharacterized protein n=1 Tax=marine sediment metagenome TaxID=412755 RepID=A0A0F9AVK9_9ZZZZ|nr:hypothetical protein [Candidatus Aminicenantes bacterium]
MSDADKLDKIERRIPCIYLTCEEEVAKEIEADMEWLVTKIRHLEHELIEVSEIQDKLDSIVSTVAEGRLK